MELTKSEEILKKQSTHIQLYSDSSGDSDSSYKSKFIEFTMFFYLK